LPYYAALEKQGNSEYRKGERKVDMQLAVILDSDLKSLRGMR
jgi:hypothetical protein